MSKKKGAVPPNTSAEPDLSEEFSDNPPPVIRSIFPFEDVLYEVYKREMWTLACFVIHSEFSKLRNPELYQLPDSAKLRDLYKTAVPMFARVEYEHVLETLERWNVSPQMLRDQPLHEDLREPNVCVHLRYGRVCPSQVKTCLNCSGMPSYQ